MMTAKDPFHVPIVLATEESLNGYGSIVTDFENVKVEKRPWPLEGWRKARKGTDIIPGEEVSEICYKRSEQNFTMKKESGRLNEIGRIPRNPCSSPTSVLLNKMTYHPDCGEVFFPKNGDPFVGVFAPPGDDFDPAKVKAFYFDGSFGVQCHPNVWHQGMYILQDEATFQGKQGILHLCVTINIVEEFGHYLSIPLQKPGQ
ncbi:uncharacterized protein LOC123540839 [Mercenaria mercenaria]|uniref:uncharacterized protein LOC123540839 n=1 Tax=Mercenaria mercenaria TaxID=6596 RepID=UPI001E1D2718|nr:uncharacterized protein LOC123540839 [Mercenaria mercenaria]